MTYRSGGTSSGVLHLEAPATPPSSVPGEGEIYFDGSQFKIAQNGSSFVNLSGAGSSNTLQTDYGNGGAGGGSITLTLSGGPLALTNPNGAAQPGLRVTQNNPGSLAATFGGGSISCSDNTASERFGSGAATSGINATALGASSSAGTSSVAVGHGASASGSQSVAVGHAVSASGSNTTAVGVSSAALATNSTAMGQGANANANSATALGRGTTASGTDSTVVGNGAGDGGNSSVTVVGSGATAGGNFGTGIGFGADPAAADSIALGALATTTAPNQLVAGGVGHAISDAYFGNGVASGTPTGVTIHATGGTGSGVVGANIMLAGGLAGDDPTAGGDVRLAVAVAGSGTTLTDVVYVSAANGNVGIGAAPGAFRLDVAGDARVSGKLTVTGAIDPVSLSLSGSTALFFDSANGSTAPVSAAGHGRIRYNNSTLAWEQSINGGAYTGFGGTSSLQGAYNGGNTIVEAGGLGVQISSTTADSSHVMQLTKNPSSAQFGDGLLVSMGANTMGNGLEVILAAGSSAEGVRVFNSGSGPAVDILNAGSGAGISITQTLGQSIAISANTADNSDVISVSRNPAAAHGGDGISMTMGPNATGAGLRVQQGNGPGIFVTGRSGGVPSNLVTLDHFSSSGDSALVVFCENISTGDAITINDSGSAGSGLSILMTGNKPSISIDQIGSRSGPIISVFGGTVTSSAALFSASQTWNNAATAFQGIFQDITNTASAAGSRLIDLQVGGSSQFSVDTAGNTFVAGKLTVTGAIDPPSISLSGGTALFLDSADGSTAPVSASGHARIRYNNSTVRWEQSVNGAAYTGFGGGSGSLQDAYDNGSTIIETGNAVSITKPTNDASNALVVNVTNGSGLAALFEGASISCLDTGFASERHGFNANATGDFSSSFGNGAQATGASSTAIGASNGYAVACFYHNNSAGTNQTNTRFASSSNLGGSFSTYSLPATTIAAGSNGQSLPQATIFVSSTTEFKTSGDALLVQTSNGTQNVTYTGVTGGPTPSFTGCSGGTGTMSTGGFVGGAAGTLHQSLAAIGSTLYAAYVQPNPGNVEFITSTDGGRTWTTPVIANPGGENPLYTSISTFDGVTIYISYYESTSRTLKLLKSTNGGATWAASTIDDGSGGTNNVGEFNAIKALDNSHVFVAYFGRTQSQALLAVSADGGGTWTLSVVGSTSGFSNVDDINVVDVNTVYVPFTQVILGVRQPVLGITTNAQSPTPTWTIHQVDPTTANQNDHLSVDSRNNGATIWVAYNNITNGVRVAKSTNSGATWTHVAVDAGSTTAQSLKMRALPGSSTEIFVVYAQNNQSPNNGLWIGVSSDGGTSWSTHVVDPNNGSAAQHPSLAFPLGASAAASGPNSTALGAGASSPNSGDVAVGAGAGVPSGTGANSTSVGFGATGAGGSTVAIGANSNATGADGVAIGQLSTASAFSVTVGGNSSGVANSVVVGVATISSGAGIVIGSSAQNNASGRSVVLGPNSVVNAATTGTNVLIGPGNTTQGAADHAVYLVGDTLTNLDLDGTTKLSNVLIVGGNNAPVKDVYFGAGPSNTANAAVNTTIHASGGGATTPGGNDLILAGGKGFTAATDPGGKVRIQVANDGASHTLVDAVFVDGNSNVVLSASGSQLAPAATNGFTYLPTTTSQPTNPPAQLAGSYAGATPTVVGTDDGTIWGYVGGQWISLGGGGSSEKIVPYTANFALTNANAGQTATNTGATGQITLTLPAITVGKVFLFAVTVAQNFVVVPFDNTATINLGNTTCTPGGSVSTNLVGSMLRVVAVSPTQWFAEIVTGEWTPS